MNKLTVILASFAAALGMTISACSPDNLPEPNTPDEEITDNPQEPQEPEDPETPDEPKGEYKVLVAYYSHSGNTKTIAEYIYHAIESDIVRIETVNPYPEDYDEHLAQAREEVAAGFHPQLANHVENMADYDVVFVGYPIWIETAAPPVASFLADHDLSGKTVVPFCTSGTSSAAESYRLVRSLCPNSVFIDGIQIRRGTYDTAYQRVLEWLGKIDSVKFRRAE